MVRWLLLTPPACRLPASEPGMCIGALRIAPRAERSEIEQFEVGQLRWCDVRECAEHDLAAAGVLAFPRIEHAAHLLALQVLLRAAQVARDDRESAPCRV